MIEELAQTLNLARGELTVATEDLEAMERNVGSDLGELRVLNDTGAGDSNLRSTLGSITNELRQARNRRQALQQQYELLKAALSDPAKLVATSSPLLESQPALRRLKDGLVDAQLKTADLAGKMSKDHPLVKAAMTAEQEVRDQLHAEVNIALRGISAELDISNGQVASLVKQAGAVEARLNRLASLRARYSNLVANVQQRSQIFEEAQRELADARASQSASESASLLTRVDEPITGDAPLGPGNTTIVACGLLGGLVFGLGLVFLIAPGRPMAASLDRPFAQGAAGHRRCRGYGRKDEPALWRRQSDLVVESVSSDAPPRRRAEDQVQQATSDDEERRQGDRRQNDRRSEQPTGS